ncbi:MAG: ATP-dependent DNA helicase [Leptospirales bacterium]|jgi:ATP-dependent DNA helicase DinG
METALPEILQVFRADSPTLGEHLPGYNHRPQQEAMARAVAATLARADATGQPQSLLVEAGTGVGKTLAYLLPLLDRALQDNTRVVVSTETKSLQSQLLEKDLPIVQELLGRRIKSEICLGASNYVCKRKLSRVMAEGGFGPEMAGRTDAFLDWESGTEAGLRSEYRGYASPAFWRKVTRDPEDCLGSRCPNYDISYYFLAREQWRAAQLLIVNHSLLASHFALEGRFLPEFSHLVIDEAHRFPEIFHGAFLNEFSFTEIQSLAQEVGRRGVDLASLFEAFRDRLQSKVPLQRGGHVRRQTGMDFAEGQALRGGVVRAEQVVRLQLEELKAQQELGFGDPSADEGAPPEQQRLQQSVEFIELQSMAQNLGRLRALLEALLNGAGREAVFWFSREAGPGPEYQDAPPTAQDARANYRMHLAPLYPGRLFQEAFFAREIRATIFTSATLTTGPANQPDAFRYFGGEVGLIAPRPPRPANGRDLSAAPTNHAASGAQVQGAVPKESSADPADPPPVPVPETLQLDSPFDYASRAILYLPQGMPDPSREENRFHEAAAREIERLLLLSRGGAFVLFTSGRSLRAVQAHFQSTERRYAGEAGDQAAFEIFSQLDQGPAAALAKFREHPRGALFGLATFWQGIDVPGDMLRLVILVRLPFRVPDEPMLAARMEREKEEGRDAFGGLQLPAATLSIKQGFGRLIRTARDRGLVAILDPRLQTKGYGKKILAVLPPARRIREFPDVARAFRDLFV